MKNWIGEFKAQVRAAQSPGIYDCNGSTLKTGENAMEKTVHNITGVFLDSSLAILGWMSFFMSFFVSDLFLIVTLLTIARVLP